METKWLGGMGVGTVLLLLLIGVVVWQAFYKEKRQDERALTAELCNTRSRLGLIEGNAAYTSQYLNYVGQRQDNIANDYSFTRGNVQRNIQDINTLNGAVFVSGCNSGCNSGCGTDSRFRVRENFKLESTTASRVQDCYS